MVHVLGPTALERAGETLSIGGKRQRAVLARLALAEGRLVTVDRLVEDLWGDDAQASILTTLHGYVSRLRGALQEPTRLRREGPGCRHSAAAAEIEAGSLPVLARATGLTSDDFLDAVDVALDEGLLAEEGNGGGLIFRHALVRQAVLERFSRTRRSTLHLTLADALEAIGSSKLELAHHLLEAGSLAAPERRVDAAVGAGREALSLLAYEDAVQWAQGAFGAASSGDVRCRCEALLLLSDAQRALGDRHAAREAAATGAAEEARATGDPVMLARAAEALALARAGVGFDLGTEDESLNALLVEALQGLPDSELGHRTKLLEASMTNAAADGDLLTLRGLSKEALGLAEALGQPGLVATAHLASRMSNWQVTLLEQRLEADRRAFDAAQHSGNAHLQMNALLYGIADLTEAGLVDETEQWLEELRSRAAKVRQPVYDAFVGFFDATIALMRGEYDRSAQLADEALLRGLQSHGVNAEHAWAGHAFIRAWDRGDLASLMDTVEQAATRSGTLPIRRVGFGACLASAGRNSAAREILAEMVTETDGIRHNPDSVWLAVGSLLTEIARAVGDTERAAILLRELRPYEGRIVLTGLGRASFGPVNRYIGVAAHVAGELDEAERLLRASAKQSRWMFAVPHEARALFDLVAVLIDRDGPDSTEAGVARERAERLADDRARARRTRRGSDAVT